MEYETYPLHTYRVSLSDRKNRRTVQAATPGEAIGKAVGARLYCSRLDSWNEAGSWSNYEVTIRTGRTVGGSTPVRSITASVERIQN